MTRKFTIGVSPSLVDEFPDLIDVSSQPFGFFDVTIVLASDNSSWIQNNIRRLRPHFVTSIEEARKVVGLYKDIGGQNS